MKPQHYLKASIIGLMLLSLNSIEIAQAQSFDDVINSIANEQPDNTNNPANNEPNFQTTDSETDDGFSRYLESGLPEIPQHEFNSEKNLPGNDKIATSLRRLMSQEKSLNSIGFKDKAFNMGIQTQHQSVYVTVSAESAQQSKAVKSSLKGEIISQFANKTYALMPLSELEALAEQGDVYSIEPQEQHYLTRTERSGKVVSEGVKAIDVSRLHKANITGKGVKIGILDFGFERYQALQQQGELPVPVATKVFNRSGKLENGQVHGTACAEIIHDMAPDAKLYLAAADGNIGTLIQAAHWLAEQGVDIISYSIGGVGGPRDGTATMDAVVKYISEKYGILWVASAGNDGARHLPLKLEDKDGNQLIDITIVNKQTDFALVKWSGKGSIFLVWDDWGENPNKPSSTQDLDMYLYRLDTQTRKWTQIASSENRQNGRTRPIERIGFREGAPEIGSILAMKIVKKNATQPVNIHLHALGKVHLYPTSPTGSIKIPATSPKALAVGAVDVRSSRLEKFSSQGPTDDGRIKPDVSAPDNNLSLAYGKNNQPGRFPGTSAACPHVSGFAALLRQYSGVTKPQALRQLVEKNVRFLEGNSPNNQYGKGYITAQAIKLKGSQSIPTDNSNQPPTSDTSEMDGLQRALEDILNQ